jgi:hypothetical protein
LYLLDQDEPAQVGKDQEIKALAEMNELQVSRMMFGALEGVIKGLCRTRRVGDSRNEAVVFDDIVERKTHAPVGGIYECGPRQ